VKRGWSWWPHIVVADMGYLAAEAKAICRKCWRVAVVTKLKVNMNLVPPYVAPVRVKCHRGQPLRWLEYAPLEDRHWFGVSGEPISCQSCWEASRCGREFAFAPGDPETLLGLLPLVSLPAQRLLQQVRPWIEPTQSYEKNQLGLSQVFFNSLHLTCCMACWPMRPCCCVPTLSSTLLSGSTTCSKSWRLSKRSWICTRKTRPSHSGAESHSQ